MKRYVDLKTLDHDLHEVLEPMSLDLGMDRLPRVLRLGGMAHKQLLEDMGWRFDPKAQTIDMDYGKFRIVQAPELPLAYWSIDYLAHINAQTMRHGYEHLKAAAYGIERVYMQLVGEAGRD